MLFVAMAISATPASAASTRAEYVALVDQVCIDTAPQFQALNRRFKKIARGFDEVRTETDVQEKRRFDRLYRRIGEAVGANARVFGGMVERLALVSPAPGDETAVGQWIEGLRQFNSLQAQSVPPWRHRHLGRVAALSEQSFEALNSGGAAVKDFGISHCPVHIDLPTTSYE
jgi:hypothetical protein